ncbi:Peptidase S74 domain-containing protein [Durusdinium trenchii]|uniref:Peptidase S74 domain-containing protein n=1 Tax=Durusdinium trenchii TaxID=1381693 RepID=A0ABP0JIB2_9DINO
MPLADVGELSDAEPMADDEWGSHMADDGEPSWDGESSGTPLPVQGKLPKYGELIRAGCDGIFRSYRPWFLPQLPMSYPNIVLVPHKKQPTGKLPKKGLLVSHPVTIRSWGTIRVFGATSKANTRFLSVRGTRDFANQVYWSRDYGKACREAKTPKQVFASPSIAERMAGLPQGWTSLRPGSVEDFTDIYPWLERGRQDRSKVVSLFSGILGLDLGLSSLQTQWF